MQRRRLLSGITAVGTIAIAGCGGENSSNEGTNSNNVTSSGPAVSTLRELIEAFNNRNRDKMLSLVAMGSDVDREAVTVEGWNPSRFEYKNEVYKKVSGEELPEVMTGWDGEVGWEESYWKKRHNNIKSKHEADESQIVYYYRELDFENIEEPYDRDSFSGEAIEWAPLILSIDGTWKVAYNSIGAWNYIPEKSIN